MHEIFPLLAGLVVGLVARHLIGPKQRIGALIIASLAIGAVASLISGELFVSWGFLAFDAAQALVAAVVAMALFKRLSAPV
ncbi:MAG: hypothetical protein ACJ8CR_20350 [Roseiflexaceae bacterium]